MPNRMMKTSYVGVLFARNILIQCARVCTIVDAQKIHMCELEILDNHLSPNEMMLIGATMCLTFPIKLNC